MGKLTDILDKAGRQAGMAIGFRGGSQTSSKPKAAAIIVAVSGADAITAAVKAGADAIIVQDDSITDAVKDAGVAWGIDARSAKKLTPDDLKHLREQGADFVLFATGMPMRALGEPVEHLERALVVPPPTDDPLMMGFRALNLVAVDAAVLDLHLTAQDLAGMTVEKFAQTRVLCESLRFPVILTLRELPAPEDMHTLARLGAQGIWLEQATPDAITRLHAELERVPRDKEAIPGVGGLLGASPTGEPRRQ